MNTFFSNFDKMPIIGVIRGVEKKDCVSVIEASVNGGFTCVEITMNTPEALQLINLTSVYFKGQCSIGAGTVLTLEECRGAIEAGAEYIVAPSTNIEIIKYCKSCGVPIIPGALTPTEIHTAWASGATMVKVFPVGLVGGADYIKEMKGPFTTVPFVAFSGISIDKVDDYFNAGVKGIGLGNRVFNPLWIKEQNFNKIEETAQAFSKAVQHHRTK
jgi:2-dehydro-3-deoxyphosphogluconate aldolase/(4S)-4-hydroxy-2-oxoglutarate aldolase